MKNYLLILVFCMAAGIASAQKSYNSYITDFQKNYVKQHEVVTKREDKSYFNFYAPDAAYKVEAAFEALHDSAGFIMPTSGTKTKKFFRYGTLKFTLNNRPLQLTLYRSESLMTDTAYKDYLFLPFTDATSGDESYGGGRYIDLRLGDIVNNKVIIDFNKAYNPYCAYAKGYNCPIPPRENDLPVAIRAGEMDFGKPH
ncbi:MAG: DUF1684 domain-containing protein [Ferruginibacter sp.]